jgi:hypothetical protein
MKNNAAQAAMNGRGRPIDFGRAEPAIAGHGRQAAGVTVVDQLTQLNSRDALRRKNGGREETRS